MEKNFIKTKLVSLIDKDYLKFRKILHLYSVIVDF